MTSSRAVVRSLLAGTALTVALAGCGGLPNNAPLVSGASPAAANSINAAPQSANSLPPGAEGLQSSGPNNTAPNTLGATFRAF